MPAASVAQLVRDSGGSLLRGDPEAIVRTFDIDTRRIQRDGCFFALKGSRTDGHEFLAEAARAGAALAMVQHKPETDAPAPPALILVDDTAAALGRCGEQARRRQSGTRWIALTGSNGKTTTKEMIAEGLAGKHRVHRTPGNYNNELGVPLTLLALPEDAQIAVLELAMSGAGEIAALGAMTDPDIGLVTNVRAVHMAFFETLDDLSAAKGELFAVMRDDAIAVVNLDDVHVRVQAARHAGARVTYGQHPAADLRLEAIDNRLLPGASLTFRHRDESIRVQLKMSGGHSAWNALAALAVVVAAGEDLRAAAERIEQLEAGPGRGKLHRLDRGVIVVDESYNNSPPALASVLDTLKVTEPQGRRVLAIGDMLELGAMSSPLHREAGRRAALAGVEVLVAVGPESRETAESARRSGVPVVHHHASSSEAAGTVSGLVRDGDLIVVKGSRGLRMERIVKALTGARDEKR